MRYDIEIESADYTVKPFWAELELPPGAYSLKRALLQLTGNVAAVDFAIYVAPKGISGVSFTPLMQAQNEVYRDSAVAATADPSPELNRIGEPIKCDVRVGESLYVRVLAGDNPVNGIVRIWL